jgi:hypothetical protein
MKSPEVSPEERAALAALEPRLGRVHIQQRLGLERDFEAHVFRKGTHFWHIENWYSVHSFIRASLWLVGLHRRGQRNALSIELRTNEVPIAGLPESFDGFTILHLSDLHVDINSDFVDALAAAIRPLRYDLCVLTGDYRARTFGPFQAALAGLERLRPCITGSAYAVLGNHDTIRMVPGMEAMGYKLLVNEWTRIARGGDSIYLAGIE